MNSAEKVVVGLLIALVIATGITITDFLDRKIISVNVIPPDENRISVIMIDPVYRITEHNQDQSTPVIGHDIRQVENLIFLKINEYRQSKDLGVLEHIPELSEVAYRHSNDMAINDYVSHLSLDGRTAVDRIHEVDLCLDFTKFSVRASAENIIYTAFGDIADSEEVLAEMLVRGWLNSPDHLANIETASLYYTGIGLDYINRDGVNYYYATQVFC